MTNNNVGICIYCNKGGAKDYAVHGRGKGAVKNFFHASCYKLHTEQHNKEVKDHERRD